MVESVLDRPVKSVNGEEVFGIGLGTVQARDAVDIFDGGLAFHSSFASNPKHLSNPRPVLEVIVEKRGGNDGAFLEPTMFLGDVLGVLLILFNQRLLSGGKAPAGGQRRRRYRA